jgi:hypothetical protein
MKLKKVKSPFGIRLDFKGKYIFGHFYESDGSGELFTKPPKKYLPCSDYGCEGATHKVRASDIKRLAVFYTNAAEEISKIEKFLKND